MAHTDLRARPLAELDRFLAGIDGPTTFAGWHASQPAGRADTPNARQQRSETDALVAAPGRRFAIVWGEPLGGGEWRVVPFSLARRGKPG